MAIYWPSSFFTYLWTEMESKSINTQKKNSISSPLDRTSLVNKGFIIWAFGKVVFFLFRIINSFIGQACSVKMAGYLPRSCLWPQSPTDKHAKKELGQYPAVLTSRLVHNPYIYFVICRGSW